MNLAGRAFRSGLLVTGSSIVARLFNLAALVVLARILVPEDFGSVALALVVVSTSSMFSSVGMGSALIASDAEPRRAAHHAGVLNLVLGIIIFTAAVVFAGPLATLLGSPDLETLFRWMSIVIILDTLAVVPDALLMKELKFGRRAVALLGSIVVQFAVAIICAANGLGVWSLVAGHITAAGARLLLTAALAPRVGWFARQPWDRTLARDLLRFGGTTMGTSLIRHAYNNADNVIVGRLFGTSTLGFYSQAYNLTNIPVQSISQVTNSVLLPSYTHIKMDRERLATGYRSALRLVALITVPMSAGIFLLAPQLVVTLLGEQWRPSVVLLQILAGMALFRPLSGTTSPIFLAIGRPGLNLLTAVVQAISMVPLVYLLYPLGPEGIAAAVSATFVFGFFFNMWQLKYRTTVPIDLRGMIRDALPVVAATVAMVVCVVGIRSSLDAAGVQLEGAAPLAILFCSGAITYAGVVFALDRTLLGELRRLMRRRTTETTGGRT